VRYQDDVRGRGAAGGEEVDEEEGDGNGEGDGYHLARFPFGRHPGTDFDRLEH
jgi:hypothetical protein